MTGITMKLTDTEPALEEVAGYKLRASDATPMFANIGLAMVTSIQHRFETGIAPDGSPWPPSLRVLARGGKTLIESGRLFRSITFQASRSSVDIGSNVVYAAIHQFGGVIERAARETVLHFKTSKNGRRRFSKASKADSAQKATIGAHSIRVPARPFIGLDDADERTITTIAEQWLLGQQGSPT